ncbi:MAG: hypothetical protein H7A45_09525 [Verrucomicrobiales bacterium]|nr:hypothetical protein [Verrucomicrobiales bacterium]MCP5526248.1 hypothetical protein [Verrucomicrobiales bacterium]
MKLTQSVRWTAVLVPLLVTLGCGGGGADPLEPISLAEIPSATTNLFATASEELRTVAYQGVAALRQRDPVRARGIFSSLSTRPELDKKQNSFVARSVSALGEEINRLAAEGDPRAQQALRAYGAGK